MRVFTFIKLNVHSLSKLSDGSPFFINNLNLGEMKWNVLKSIPDWLFITAEKMEFFIKDFFIFCAV